MSSIADDDDVISSLPDDVLCRILMLLPTRQTVATSILSKRWINLWRSVPTLDLTYIELNDIEVYSRFNDFVYSVLLARNCITRCNLGIWYEDPHLGDIGFPNVIKWINTVLQRRVEYLKIDIAINYNDIFNLPIDRHHLPITILSCKTLVDLDFFGHTLKGFSSIALPSLKSLRLQCCNFLNIRDLLLLLDGCPILEKLNAIVVEFNSGDSLTYQECERLSLSKLIKAKMPRTWVHFPLKALHNVKELYIEINKVYRSFDEIPTFRNLTKLKLHSINYNWNLLVQVLSHCPILQNVELSQVSLSRSNDGIGGNIVQENWVDPIFVPPCLSLCLKICKFLKFLGQEGELLLAKYILKNARVLQTMTICCPDKDLKNESELSLCPKVSPTCELVIECQWYMREY